MRGSIYCLLAYSVRWLCGWSYLLVKKYYDAVACDDFLHSLLWSSALVLHLDLLMIIVCDVNNHIIVQSEVVFTTCEVINIFLFILGLWSLSLIVASDVKLCAIGSEHRPYSQRLHCQPLCFSVIAFGSPFSLTFEYNYVRCCSSNSAAIHAGLWEEIQQRSLFSCFGSSSVFRCMSSSLVSVNVQTIPCHLLVISEKTKTDK